MTKVNPRVALKGMPLGKNDWEPWIKNSSHNYYDVSMSNRMSKRINHWTMLLDFFFFKVNYLWEPRPRDNHGQMDILSNNHRKHLQPPLWLLRCSCATNNTFHFTQRQRASYMVCEIWNIPIESFSYSFMKIISQPSIMTGPCSFFLITFFPSRWWWWWRPIWQF